MAHLYGTERRRKEFAHQSHNYVSNYNQTYGDPMNYNEKHYRSPNSYNSQFSNPYHPGFSKTHHSGPGFKNENHSWFPNQHHFSSAQHPELKTRRKPNEDFQYNPNDFPKLNFPHDKRMEEMSQSIKQIQGCIDQLVHFVNFKDQLPTNLIQNNQQGLPQTLPNQFQSTFEAKK